MYEVGILPDAFDDAPEIDDELLEIVTQVEGLANPLAERDLEDHQAYLSAKIQAKLKVLARDKDEYSPAEQRVIGEGDKAHARMFEENLGLLAVAVRKNAWWAKHGASTASDVFQMAAFGLNSAIEQFDPEKGRFSTLAMWVMTQQLQVETANTAKLIRLPREVERKVGHIVSMLRKGSTEVEIMKHLKIDRDEFIDLQAASAINRDLEWVDGYFDGVESNEMPRYVTLVDSSDWSDPVTRAHEAVLRYAVNGEIAKLSHVQQQVAELVFGLIDGVPRQNNQAAEELGITANVVKKHKAKVLRTLGESAELERFTAVA